MPKSELKQLCKKFADIRKSAVVGIFLPEEPLLPEHLLEIQKCITKERVKDLAVILHSSGGDINSTYQIIELLRSRCEHMITVIPLYAKSAASLFILGSDKIIMGELAETGPLDSQIVEREKGGRKYTSALNPFKTLEELQKFSLGTLDVTVKLLLTRADFSVEEAIKHAMEFTARISAPLFSQLNTEKIGVYSRALAVGRDYGERLIKRYGKKENIENRDTILEKLIRGYPSHDYIIDYKELGEVGFDVSLPSNNEKEILEGIVEYLLESSQTEIFYIGHEKQVNIRRKVESGKERR